MFKNVAAIDERCIRQGPMRVGGLLPRTMVCLVSLLLLLVLFVGSNAFAQSDDEANSSPATNGRDAQVLALANVNQKNGNAKSTSVSESEKAKDLFAEREEEILAFTEQHQPELIRLLKFMKEKQAGDYPQAIREMGRTVQRLINLEARDSELYQVELMLWKTRAALRLRAAQISALGDKNRPRLMEELKGLLEAEYQQEVKRLEILRTRAKEQLAALEEQLERKESNHDTIINRSLKNWETRIGSQTKKKRSP